MTIQHLDIALTPTTVEDGASLADLRVEAMRESLERIGRFDPVRARERFLGGFVPANTCAIELGGRRVGFLAVRRNEQGFHLEHLYLHPSEQGQGIGAAVLRQLCQQADQEGLSIRLGALKQSDSNRFYQRHGFELTEEGEFDLYYVRPAVGV
jgi:GNAT superfamily N-acetyltransferase